MVMEKFSVFSFLYNPKALAGLKPGTYKIRYGRKSRFIAQKTCDGKPYLTRKKRGFGMTALFRSAE
jgi:hypothetical protein